MKLNTFKLLKFIYIFCNPIALVAQVAEEEINLDTIRSDYISPIPEYLTFQVGLHTESEGFASYNSNQIIDIRPNANTYLKLGASYRFVTLSYAFSAGFLPGNGDNDLKGKSNTSHYAMQFFLPRINQSIYYARTRGYYLYNTDDYVNGWRKGTDPYIQFPDLVHIGFGGITGFRLNRNFSFPAIYAFSERQIKSAGTFVQNLKYNYYIIDDRTPLTGTNSSQKSNNLMITLSPGYFYTFVLKEKFYFTLGVYGDAGLVHTRLTTRTPQGDFEGKNNDFLYGIEFQGAIGYNGPRFFTGVVGKLYYNQHRQSGTTQYLAKDTFVLDFTIGYRFNAPSGLVRHFNKREEQQTEMLNKLKAIFKGKKG